MISVARVEVVENVVRVVVQTPGPQGIQGRDGFLTLDAGRPDTDFAGIGFSLDLGTVT